MGIVPPPTIPNISVMEWLHFTLLTNKIFFSPKSPNNSVTITGKYSINKSNAVQHVLKNLQLLCWEHPQSPSVFYLRTASLGWFGSSWWPPSRVWPAEAEQQSFSLAGTASSDGSPTSPPSLLPVKKTSTMFKSWSWPWLREGKAEKGVVNVQNVALVKTYLLSLMSLHLIHQDFPPPLLSLSSSGLIFLQPLSDLTDIIIIRGGLYQLNGIQQSIFISS